MVGLSDGATETVSFVVVVVVLSVAVTVTLAAAVVAFRASAVVLIGDEVTFTVKLVVLGGAVVTCGPGVVNDDTLHCSSICTTTLFPLGQ